MYKDERETVFILGDSMVRNVNGFLITRNIGHKYLVKVRSFNGAKVRCMEDHSKPTVRNFNPKWIILHVGTNDLKLKKKAGRISKSIMELASSLKNNNTNVAVSFIVPRNDALSGKVAEVNNRLRIMCNERNFAFIDHSEYIQPDLHLNGGKLHLNRYGDILFSKKMSTFISQLC